MGCVFWVGPLCKESVDITVGCESATELGNTRTPLGSANENNPGTCQMFYYTHFLRC